MCGIAGHVHRAAAASHVDMGKQLAMLRHRGPDACGGSVAGRSAIGQARLSVIDLQGGDPPVTAAGGAVSVAFNGEIYNYRQLREELRARGRSFGTASDTEVLAELCDSDNPVAELPRLQGMFAFATWDSRSETLVLVRDRLGKKPLYYWHDESTFVFGSEIKAVLSHPAVARRLNVKALPTYLAMGYVPTPDTFYDNIRSVPPGCALVLRPDFTCRLERYWEPNLADASTPADMPLEEAARQIRQGLDEAVQRRLVADVPLGAFLSGGVDSAAVVALMSRHLDRPVKTFTIGFSDPRFDESKQAEQVAAALGTDHETFVVSPDAVELVESLVWHHDQPFGDSSAIPMYLLAQQTRQHVTVALSGDGGDELFAGYERFRAGVLAGSYQRVPPVLRAQLAGALSRSAPGSRAAKAARFARAATAELPESYREWVGYVPGSLVKELTGSSTYGQREYDALWQKSAGAPLLNRLLLLNLDSYLLDDLLPKVDRTTMAHGLEVRSPLLDHELLELAFRLPLEAKMRGRALKRGLKLAVADVVPAEVLRRPKKGFGVPLDGWFRGELRSYVADMLGSSSTRCVEHLDGQVVRRILAEHAQGRAGHGHVLWTLLTLEVFLRREGW